MNFIFWWFFLKLLLRQAKQTQENCAKLLLWSLSVLFNNFRSYFSYLSLFLWILLRFFVCFSPFLISILLGSRKSREIDFFYVEFDWMKRWRRSFFIKILFGSYFMFLLRPNYCSFMARQSTPVLNATINLNLTVF